MLLYDGRLATPSPCPHIVSSSWLSYTRHYRTVTGNAAGLPLIPRSSNSPPIPRRYLASLTTSTS